jgi:1-acyl-sn-glycerol-3-phosphate acyltransferase
MADTRQPRVTRPLVFIQWLLGFGAYCVLALPYLRRVHHLDRLRSGGRLLMVSNHVSLIDTVLLGALCWRAGCYPIVVLGDRKVWHASWIKKLLSSRIGFLLERGKLNPNRIEELEAFGRAGGEFNLVVFPEGTRGDGVNVAPCQPGLHYIAQAARLPIVPLFIENMQLVSTKSGRFHALRGLRKVEVHIGEVIAPEKYLALSRDEFSEFVRQSIATTRSPSQPAVSLIPVLPRV